jgi:hypothetical protein
MKVFKQPPSIELLEHKKVENKVYSLRRRGGDQRWKKF